MPKQTIYTCQCGCGASIEGEPKGWIKLSQFPYAHSELKRKEIKVDGELYFQNLSCVKKWLVPAVKVIPGLLKRAQSTGPHGSFAMVQDEQAPGIYV